MPDFFIFLMKVNAALILFCLAYFLVLRKLTFYTLNRFFLLAGILFSTLYPFVDPSTLFAKHEALISPITPVMPHAVTEVVAAFDYWLLLKFVFWTGVTVMGLRTLIRFISLYRVHRRSVPGKIREYPVRILEGNVNTFSFWQNIYLNPSLHHPRELDAILEHESVHVNELHTLDILLAELSTVFYWFNPGVWYMRKAVKENVEFITDQKILQKGADRKAYQYSMLNSLKGTQPSVLMNNFNITAIKRRIIMMNSKRSSSLQLVRYLFLLPVLLVLTTAFTLFRTEVKSVLKEQQVFQKTVEPQVAAEKPVIMPLAKKKVKSSKGRLPDSVAVPARPDEEIAPSEKERKFVFIQNFKGDESDTASKSINGIAVIHLKGKIKNVNVDRTDTISNAQIFSDGDATMAPPIIFIDDKAASKEELKRLNPSEIANIKMERSKEAGKPSKLLISTKAAKN